MSVNLLYLNMKAKIKRILRKIISPIRRLGLKNKNFSIISNNCWGGIVYDIFGLQYLSPTIGLFMFSDDYIKFCENLEYYLKLPIIEIKVEESRYCNELKLKNINCPIGKIKDVELIFLHYKNFNDAKVKWERRCKRVKFDNLIIKFSDQNLFREENYYKFMNLSYKNKIFITGNKKYIDEKNVVYLNQYQKIGYAKDDIKSSFKRINLKKFFNNIER